MAPPPSIQEGAFVFACGIVELSQHLDRSTASRHVGGQVLRSGTAIGAHLEEAHGRQSKADFISKVSLALKEARETLYWLRVIAATKLLPPNRLQPLIREANELVAILTAIRKTAERKQHR